MSYNLIQNSPNLVGYIGNFLDPTDRICLYPCTGGGLTNQNFTTAGANRLFYIPFIVPKDITLQTLGIAYATSGSPSTFNINVGIYDDNNYRPNNKLIETGVLVSGATATNIETTVSINIEANKLYWVAGIISGGTWRATSANGSPLWMGISSSGAGNTSYYEDLLAGRTTLPTTPSTLTVNRSVIPRIVASF